MESGDRASSTHSISGHPSKVNLSGVYKVERVGPIFRIIDSYDKRKNPKLAASQHTTEEAPDNENEKRQKGELYANDKGPFWHDINNPMLTPPAITENLPRQFESLPISGTPESAEKLEEYQNKLIREFVGCDLDDREYEDIENFSSIDMLKTGKELQMVTRAPVAGDVSKNLEKDLNGYSESDDNSEAGEQPVKELSILRKLRTRLLSDPSNIYARSLKYRGIKLVPLTEQESLTPDNILGPPELEPGKDVLFRIRTYRPFTLHFTGEKQLRGRHSIFNCDIVMLGRQALTSLRDSFTCRNDIDMRVDRSACPGAPAAAFASAKDAFPSGFLFINNVFYVDGRPGCRDTSEMIRRWASERGMGDFPVRNMQDYTLGQVLVKLAHPDVYVHQGNCEHVFLLSEVRLVSRADPLHLAAYPCHTAISQNQTIYCTTCAEFGAKWLVTDSCKVPFDPAFFCDTCFHSYLYKDKRKIDQFKAYAYKGNELNLKSTKTLSNLK